MSGDIVKHKPADVFKTFPEFSKLTLNDRKKFAALVRDYPPISDINFHCLMIHWSGRDANTVSTLNGNLVLSYWLAGSENFSGLCLVGTKDIDRTICEIFDAQRARGEKPRLVHVPEFVIENIEHGELFAFKGERSLDEYIVPLSKLAIRQDMPLYKKHRIKRFMQRLGSRKATVRPLDLDKPENIQSLMSAVETWSSQGFINNAARHVNETIDFTIENAAALGISALGLYIDDAIAGFILYHAPRDERFMMLTHALVDYSVPYAYDYMIYAFANWFVDRGFVFANLDSDIGLPLLRVVKMSLGPVNFFRKYTIEPAS